jgi:hypothetical protein
MRSLVVSAQLWLLFSGALGQLSSHLTVTLFETATLAAEALACELGVVVHRTLLACVVVSW